MKICKIKVYESYATDVSEYWTVVIKSNRVSVQSFFSSREIFLIQPQFIEVIG